MSLNIDYIVFIKTMKKVTVLPIHTGKTRINVEFSSNMTKYRGIRWN